MLMFLAQGATTVELTFTGGEPLLRFPDLQALADRAQQRAHEYGMVPQFVLKTNGTILNPQILAFLSDGPWRVVVSIDGAATAHDLHRRDSAGNPTYQAVSRTIATLIASGVACAASLTVHPNACDIVVSNVRHLHSMGLTNMDVGPVYGTVPWSREEVSRLAKSLNEVAMVMRHEAAEGRYLEVGPIYRESEHVGEKLCDTWGCHAGSRNLAFLPDGSIAGCSALAMLVPRFQELVLGNVWEGIDERALAEMLRLAQAGARDRSRCRQCPTASNCRGGCLAINYATTGLPLHPPDLYCRTISAIPNAWRLAWA